MRRYILAVFVIVHCVCSASAGAQTSVTPRVVASSSLGSRTGAPAEVIKVDISPNALPSLEIAVLKAQLEQFKSFQDSMLNTVWWALGVVVTLLVVLSSVNWFTTFKLYERDKEALKRELDAKVEERFNASQALISEGVQAAKTSADELTASVKSEFAELIATAKKELEAEITRVGGAAEDVSKRRYYANWFLLADLKYDFFMFRKWELVAVGVAMQIVRNGKDAPNEFWIKKGLDHLIESLKGLEADPVKAARNVKTATSALEALSSLAETYGDQTAEVRAIVQRIEGLQQPAAASAAVAAHPGAVPGADS